MNRLKSEYIRDIKKYIKKAYLFQVRMDEFEKMRPIDDEDYLEAYYDNLCERFSYYCGCIYNLSIEYALRFGERINL